LKAPGFNPRAYEVKTWFQNSVFKFNLYRYTADLGRLCVRVAAADDLLDHMIRHDMARRGKDTRSPTFNEALALESTASAAGPSVPSPPTVGLYSTS
jgi:hypothetical protein